MAEEKKFSESSNAFHDFLFNHGADMSKERALELCSGHLQGNWTTITPEDIDLNVVQGGFVNRIFLCINKKSNEKVLIRLYGGKILPQGSILRNVGLEGEVLIFHTMDVNNIGPKLLGIFDEGRLEEYHEGTDTLTNEHLENPEVIKAFARKLARIHSLKMPFTKKPKDYIGICREYFPKYWAPYQDFIRGIPLPEGAPEEHKKAIDFVLNYDFTPLIDWFEKMTRKFPSKVIFSHNDMNRANCLVDPSKTGDDKVTLLDFELSGYNYRGCDIGHHFKNRMIDIQKFTKKETDLANSFMKQLPYPTEEERREFIRAYLEVALKSYDSIDKEKDSEEYLLLEAELYGALYHLFFTAYMISTVEQFKAMGFDQMLNMQPGLLMAHMIKDHEDRRQTIMDLETRFASLKL